MHCYFIFYHATFFVMLTLTTTWFYDTQIGQDLLFERHSDPKSSYSHTLRGKYKNVHHNFIYNKYLETP